VKLFIRVHRQQDSLRSRTKGGDGNVAVVRVDEVEMDESEEDEGESLQELCSGMLRPELTLQRLSFMALQHKDKINRSY
jgi:hypothetical protein